MKTTRYLFLIVVLSFNIVNAQQIDLSQIDPGKTFTTSIDAGKVDQVVIRNMFSKEKYEIEIKKMVSFIPELEMPGGVAAAAGSECDALGTLYGGLLKYINAEEDKCSSKSEKELGNKIDEIKKELSKTKCTDAGMLSDINNLIGLQTRAYPLQVSVGNGESLQIVIRRKCGSEVLEWKIILEAPERGRWVMTYGFGFTSKRGYDNYFSEKASDTTFRISKGTKYDTWDLSYTPAIFYSWFPSKRYLKNMSYSLTGGLGFNVEAPVVFLGGSLMFNQNIGASVGAAFNQQPRLLTKYKEGQIIQESLDSEQLHEQVYRPTLYFAVMFRFSENPFKKKEDTSGE